MIMNGIARFWKAYERTAITVSEALESLENSAARLIAISDPRPMRKYRGMYSGIATVNGKALRFVYDPSAEHTGEPYSAIIWNRMQQKFGNKVMQLAANGLE